MPKAGPDVGIEAYRHKSWFNILAARDLQLHDLDAKLAACRLHLVKFEHTRGVARVSKDRHPLDACNNFIQQF